MERLRKQYKKILVLVLMASNMCVWVAVSQKWPSTKLSVYFFDVGQGDSILIDSPTHGRVLVDGGSNAKVLTELGKVLPFGDRRIDIVLETHPDKDHLGGLSEVINRFEVKNFIESGVVSPTKVDTDLKQKLLDKNIPDLLARRGMVINFNDGARLEILFPNTDVSKWPTNDASVVAKLVYGEKSFLLTGDSPKKSENMLLALDPSTSSGQNSALKSTVLKVGHHGSKTSTSLVFANAVSPEYAVISVGLNNRYGHPNQETLDILNKLGTKILSTINLGTIKFETDGLSLNLK